MDDRGEIDPTRAAEAEALGRATAAATGGGVGAGGEGMAGGPLDRALATLADVAEAILAPRRMRERAFEELEAVRSLRAERDRWRDHALDLVRSHLIEGGIRIDRANEMADAWAAKVALQIADEAKGGAA